MKIPADKEEQKRGFVSVYEKKNFFLILGLFAAKELSECISLQ